MRYTNPILPGFHPDPSICRLGGDFFLVTSSFEFFPGVPLFHSRDLVDWRQVGHCLTRESQLPLGRGHWNCSTGIFAPTIRCHDGRFYMITTNIGNGGNFFVWTDDPFGEWSEPVWIPKAPHSGSSDFENDPSLLFDDDGTVYLTTHRNEQCVIDIESGKRGSDVRTVWEGAGGGNLEAPHLYHIGDYYYLMAAEGGTERRHRVTIARSRSPWGPFESCPHNPILSNWHRRDTILQATGHGDLVDDAAGNWWMVFLAIRDMPTGSPRTHHLGRETCLAPVAWVDGWPVVNGNGTADLRMEGPLPRPAQPRGSDGSGDPAPCGDRPGPANDPAWTFLRNPHREHYSWTERPGWLALRPSAVTLDDVGSPTWIGKRLQHPACEASTLMDFAPGPGEEAGLTIFMNHRHHCEIALRAESGQARLVVRRRIGSLLAETWSQPFSGGRIRLGVVATPNEFVLFFEDPKGGARIEADRQETRYLSTEVASGFTGVFLALYATARTRGTPVGTAYFDGLTITPARA
ncbi:MAG: glycoside hydrolase family 43 protein [Puniceicoccaceae bacterium]